MPKLARSRHVKFYCVIPALKKPEKTRMAAEEKARYNRDFLIVKASAMYARLLELKPPEPPKEVVEAKKHESKPQQAKSNEGKTNECKPPKTNKSESQQSKPNEGKYEPGYLSKLNNKPSKHVSFAENVTVKNIPISKKSSQTDNGQQNPSCLAYGNIARNKTKLTLTRHIYSFVNG